MSLNSAEGQQRRAIFLPAEQFGKKSPFLFATFSFGEAKEKVGADGQNAQD